jgi:ribonuclease III
MGGPDMASDLRTRGANSPVELSRPQRSGRSGGAVTPPHVAALEVALGHRFVDSALLERALTHASYVNEHPPAISQDGLAFVGDAALGLVVAERLLAREPDAAVGVLTPARAALVSGASLARWAVSLGLGGLVRLGRGEEQTGGRERESILATTLEALLGVLYLEGGLEAVRRAVDRLARDAS